MGGQVSSPCKSARKGQHGTDDNDSKKRGRGCVKKNTKRGIARITRLARSTNPFILFYLRMQRKRPKKSVVEVARKAGKLWCQMSIDQRKKYIALAQAEKKRKAKKYKRRCPKHK